VNVNEVIVAPDAAPDTVTEVVKFVLSVPFAELETGAVDNEIGATPKDAVWPGHNVASEPAFAVGEAITVTVRVAVAFGHPAEPNTVYVIVAVPAETPLTTPDELTVAIAALLVDQEPPAAPLLEKVVVEPEQTVCVPLKTPALAPATIVTGRLAEALPHAPPFTVYVIVAFPELIALTKPVELTVAIAVFEELHVPPAFPVVVNAEVPPGQID